MKNITLTQVADLAEFAKSRNVVTVTAGPVGDVLFLLLEQPLDYKTKGKGAIFAKHFAEKPNRFRICRLLNGSTHCVDLPETRDNYHQIQPLGRNQWLLVRGRSDGGSDMNAHIYSDDGLLLRTFHAGDGIEDVQTTSDGDIWVSYFDQGVYGSDELGHHGLVCFDENGRLNFAFSSLPDVPDISDCYALNVACKDDVWLYYYTEFPLIRLRKKQLSHVWPDMPVRGAPAFAVTKDRVLFAGGYEQRDSLLLVSFFPIAVQELQPVDSEGEPVTSFLAFGRGSKLYLQRETILYMVDVDEVW